MVESRWLALARTGVIALGAVGLVASTRDRRRAASLDATFVRDGRRRARFRGALGRSGRPRRPAAWSPGSGSTRARPDAAPCRANGWPSAPTASRSSQVIDLPPESFAAGPFGRIVLVGSDDGPSSRLEAVDVAPGAPGRSAREATSSGGRPSTRPAGPVYEMRVDRVTRADLGIWARPLDGGRRRPPRSSPRSDPTRVSADLQHRIRLGRGRRPTLAVQSCGEAACRTRILDPATGGSAASTSPTSGRSSGWTATSLVTYGACPGLPCPIVATDIATGDRPILADAAGFGASRSRRRDGRRSSTRS